MRVTLRIPMTADWLTTINVPNEAIEKGVVNFLEDNPEYLEDIESNGVIENERLEWLSAVVED